MNQTTIFHLSRSSLELLCVPRSRPRPRRPRLPFNVWNSQLFTGLDYKSTEHNQGRVNVSVGVEVGAPAVLCAQKWSANYTQINQRFSIVTMTLMRHVLGMRLKALPAKSTPGVRTRTRVYITPSQPQNSPQRRQSPLMHPVHGMTLRRAAILRS
jgi:hypothetical protein